MSEDAKRQAAFQYLNETVPNMPVGFGDNLSEVVFDALPHSQAQQVIMASMNLVPDLDRAAFTKVTTVADIVAWLGPAASVWAENRGRIVNRPRGSYVTAAATLRPLVDGDLDLAYMASLNPQNSHRWRYRGQTPSPEDFRRSVFAPGILAQFAVVSSDDRLGAAAGMVVAYDADLTNGYSSVAFQRFDPEDARRHAGRQPERGLMIDGLLIFFQYLFDHFTFRKIYLEIPEYNLSLFEGSAAEILVEEGRLKDHHYYGDRFWDLYLYALYRERWDEVAEPFRGAWLDR